VTPQAGPVNTIATLSGTGFLAGPIDVKWENGATGATYLPTQAQGPNFSIQVRIAEGMPVDVYNITAKQPNRTARATYTVTEGYASDPAPGLSGNSEFTGPGTTGSGADSAGTGGGANPTLASSSFGGTAPAASGRGGTNAPAPAQSVGGPSQPTTQLTDSPSTPAGAAVAPGSAPGDGVSVESTSDPAGTAFPGQPAGPSAIVSPTPPAPASANAPVPAGSGNGTAPVSATPAEAAAQVARLSPRTATADLWSGLGARKVHGQATLTEPAASGGPDDAALGMGLVTAGILALGAGFGVAEARRRRVRVSASSR